MAGRRRYATPQTGAFPSFTARERSRSAPLFCQRQCARKLVSVLVPVRHRKAPQSTASHHNALAKRTARGAMKILVGALLSSLVILALKIPVSSVQFTPCPFPFQQFSAPLDCRSSKTLRDLSEIRSDALPSSRLFRRLEREHSRRRLF